MSWMATKLISIFLLPPLNLLLVALAGWLLLTRRPRLGHAMVGAGLAGLWLISSPLVAHALLRTLESTPPLPLPPQEAAQAIVILGGGSYLRAPEYGTDTVSHWTLERIRYGAVLHQKTRLPVLVSGGNPHKADTTEAAQMAQALARDFGVPVRWQEGASNNTRENARFSQQILARENIQRVYLVTHAWHMPRAKAAFQRAGLNVIPAPMAFTPAPSRFTLLGLLPDASALLDSHHFFHEVIGLLWYRIQG
jgi:uncharacterized SAM-binding protein YcdF (DUF218 family)